MRAGLLMIAVRERIRQVERESCVSERHQPQRARRISRREHKGIFCVLRVTFAPSAVKLFPLQAKPLRETPMANRTAVIQTNQGTIRFELLEEDAPKTTENFRLLAEKGFYDGVIFHRCIKGFMIQGGDPTGTGRGGQSAWGGRFDDEINPSSEVYKLGYKAGTVAMANAGPNTNGSQFFIMHSDYGLPPSYTIFGRVTEGQDVVNAIATSKTDGSDRPLSEVKMEKVTIE